MGEVIFTFCDVCNTEENMSPFKSEPGRGYVKSNRETAVKNFDWKELRDGRISCIECQDEARIR